MKKKPILAFDCALVGASVTVLADGRVYQRNLPQSRQAAELVPAIEQCMHEANATYAELGAIISTNGPGSFTGLRIGLAALHGLALVAQVPVKILSTLEALAWQVSARTANEAFITAIQAGKGEVAAQAFRMVGDSPVADGSVYLVPQTYDAWPLPCYGNHLLPEDTQYIAGVDTAHLCAIEAALPVVAVTEAVPFYIRPPDAAIPKPFAWLASDASS